MDTTSDVEDSEPDMKKTRNHTSKVSDKGKGKGKKQAASHDKHEDKGKEGHKSWYS